MPIYGEAKKRNMARSVLPSKRRKAAKDNLANIKRKNRAKVRQAVRHVQKGWDSSDVIDNYDEASFDFDFYPDAEIQYEVRDRRDADNLSALYRWAPSQVEGVRLQDRVSKFYTFMPDNTIGRHAVGHVAGLDEFDIREEFEPTFLYERMRTKEYKMERFLAACEYAAVAAKLEYICDAGLLPRFNEFNCIGVTWHRCTEEEFVAMEHKHGENKYGGRDHLGYRRTWNWKALQPHTVYEKRKYGKVELGSKNDIDIFIKAVGAHGTLEGAFKYVGV